MTHQQLLTALLSVVRDFCPLDRTPPLSTQVTRVGDRLVFLWDARDDADEGIACAVAGQFGVVVASTTTPFVGVLIDSAYADHSMRMLGAAYATATGPQNPENPF